MPTLEQARSWYDPTDPVHGFDHIQRVYALARQIAQTEGADIDTVSAAALLHDAEDRNGENDGNHHAHQISSADFARKVLQAEDWPPLRISAVEHCIKAHRFRDPTEQPQSLEAQVLFDADKLDAIGAIGVARAIAFAARHNQPAYAPPSDHFLQTGETEPGESHSAYHEYLFKLRKLKDRMFTETGRAMAVPRHQYLAVFFRQLVEEANLEETAL
jgi:uncharacterized protein